MDWYKTAFLGLHSNFLARVAKNANQSCNFMDGIQDCFSWKQSSYENNNRKYLNLMCAIRGNQKNIKRK